MSIIYENKDYIIYNKPAGKLVQSDRSFDIDVVSELKTYLAKKGEGTDVSVINRLDRPVSGLVLLAKNKDFAGKVSKVLSQGGISKEYCAVVCGKLPEKSGVLVDYLLKDGKNNMSTVVATKVKGAKEAKLEYRVCAEKEIEYLGQTLWVSLVRIKLITGCHHQIRVQFASRNNPLLGDTKYNSVVKETGGWRNISLCSTQLVFLGMSYEVKPDGDGFEYFKEELGKL